MKAISIRQPFAELIVLGEKRLEFKSRLIRWRGDLLIHAATYRPRYELGWVAPDGGAEGLWTDSGVAYPSPDRLDYGALVGIVQVVDCLELCDALERYPDQQCFRPMADCFAWVLAEPRRITPVPMLGRQGFWNVDDAVLLRHPATACDTPSIPVTA